MSTLPPDLTSTWGVDAFRNPGVARFRKQLDADTWANERALNGLDSIPPEGRNSPAFERAMQLLPHNQLAKTAWLARIKQEAFENPKNWFPNWTLDQTREFSATTDKTWREFLDKLRDDQLQTTVKYTNSRGETYAALLEDILIHVFNHATYHRGQLARIVSECGGKRPETDHITFACRPVSRT